MVWDLFRVSIHSRLFKPGESVISPNAFRSRLFQSTPDYLNRENPATGQRDASQAAVSIHSRLFKPGESVLTKASLHWIGQFQSTPDYLNRENAHKSRIKPMRGVSIHSRLFKPGEWASTHHPRCTWAGFNPLPII